MLIVGSNRPFLNNKENEPLNLAMMGKEGYQVEDVEEGEISDGGSVEEISEEDFKKPEARVSKPNSDSKVWYGDLYKYPISHNYAPGLYSLAWAQAVQNKPLDEVLVMDYKPGDSLKRSSMSSSSIYSRGGGNVHNKDEKNISTSSSKEASKVIIDDSSEDTDARMEDAVEVEKEEGELEEGEIDFDSDFPEKPSEEGISDANSEIDLKERESERDLKPKDLIGRVNLIREAFQSVIAAEAEKSYDDICSLLQNTFENLQEIVMENNVPKKDDLIQLSFTAIQAVNSSLCYMKQQKKEHSAEALSRLLDSVSKQVPPIFSPDQMKEIGMMVASHDSHTCLSSAKATTRESELLSIDGKNKCISEKPAENGGGNLSSSKEFLLKPISVESLIKAETNLGKLGVSNSKGRGGFGPLLDLHKDHDADSLPSPTRDNTPPCFSLRAALQAGDSVDKSDSAIVKMAQEKEDPKKLLSYETDALKAVSTYQQKFGRNSFFLDNRLPSPTPSEECNDVDRDTSEEVSSSSSIGYVRTVTTPILAPTFVSSSHQLNNSIMTGQTAARNAVVGSNQPSRASSKSRDPRLRQASSDGALDLNQSHMPGTSYAAKVDQVGCILSLRKNKVVEEPILDGPVSKRPRNGSIVSGSGGGLEESGKVGPQLSNRSLIVANTESDPRKYENGISNNIGKPIVTAPLNEQVPVTGASISTSLPALLKDFAVNPNVLVNFIMEQQRLAAEAEAQRKSGDFVQIKNNFSSSDSTLGAIPSVTAAMLNPSGPRPNMAGKPLVPSNTASVNPPEELGKVRMKPRDPRRVLHGTTFQQSGSVGSDQLKKEGSNASNVTASKGCLNLQMHDDTGIMNSIPSQSVVLPDIARQFTKNLKNIANIVSVSQESTTPVVPSRIPTSSEPVHVNPDGADAKTAVLDSDHQLTGTNTKADEIVSGGLDQSQNTWGDVEHLFEGYDDQQKAAIQRERARRIEEQKKMFASRKLSLVLDLDHTLLNSAKFVEVDPVHEEILRKKEEQDRGNLQRHLFRFPHMGMWTKLRPGIWNFLEKASKLFELHLYTMGNKLYATEMAKVLDPKGVLFAGRVISRGDDGDLFDGDERVPKSKDLDGVLGMESAVIIIDDSVRVWPHNKLNLIVVERYTYFPCSRRQFGLPGPSLLEIDHDERPEDGTLASSLLVIERIHKNFFSNQSLDEVDVRNILASEQQKILGGCRIVFSRVFPVDEANPHLHPLWQTAEQFGAVCTNQIDEQVTHVVANSLGTDKVNWALSTGRFVVHPGWVEASALLYRRANEQDFAIKP